MANILVVVVPRGHGKSDMHDPETRIFDYERTVSLTDQSTLERTLLEGRSDYSRQVVARVIEKIGKAKAVLLVPDRAKAHILGLECQTTMILRYDVIQRLLQGTDQTFIDHWMNSYHDALRYSGDVKVVDSRTDLRIAVIMALHEYTDDDED